MRQGIAGRPRWVALLVTGLLTAVPAIAAAQNEATTGQWSPLVDWPITLTHTHLMPNGKVFAWGEYDWGPTPYIYDPATDQLTPADGPGYNPFCGGHTLLGDGRLLEMGGHVASHIGFPNTSTWDWNTSKWTSGPNMNAGRWYPTAITLPNGDALIMSGEMAGAGDLDTIHEVFEAKTNTLRELKGAALKMPFYPRAFVAPNGKVFVAGTQQANYIIDTTGSGTISPAGASNYGARDYGGAVMYDIGKILLVGGGLPPTNTAEVIDLNAPAPTWRYVASMSAARRQHNTTMLPDGTVLVTGGSSGAVFNDPTGDVPYAELWDPVTEKWTKLASADIYRGYHSTSLLLPDGRILNGGGRGPLYLNTQIYSPPYLFKGARPTLSAAPAEVWPNADFEVATPDGADIKKVSLIRLGSLTHSWNTNQRFIPLQFKTGGAGLIVTGPKDNNIAPTGHYMLFLVNSAGVPSVAKIVHVVYGPEAGPPPPIGPPPPPADGGGPKEVASPEPKSKGGCSTATGTAIPLAGLLALAALLRRRAAAARTVRA